MKQRRFRSKKTGEIITTSNYRNLSRVEYDPLDDLGMIIHGPFCSVISVKIMIPAAMRTHLVQAMVLMIRQTNRLAFPLKVPTIPVLHLTQGGGCD